MNKAILPLVITLFLMQSGYAQYTKDIRVQEIKDNYIIYNTLEYRWLGNVSINASNLNIDILYHDVIRRQSFKTEADVINYLLSNGYATIIDTQKASQKEIEAENSAKNAEIGVWKKDEPKNKGGILRWIKNNYKSIITFILGSGFIGFIYSNRKKINQWYYERKINLLVLGEPSAGKTALIKVISDEHTTEQFILSLSPTIAEKDFTGSKIYRGRYEFIPMMTDISGGDYGLKAEMISSDKNNAIIYVLSFTQKNNSSDFDDKYMNVQLGALRAQFGQIINLKKPLIFILFINKFDLLSKNQPEDTSSSETKKKIMEAFNDHINEVKIKGKQHNIAIEVIIGSCVKRWNTHGLLDKITNNIKK